MTRVTRTACCHMKSKIFLLDTCKATAKQNPISVFRSFVESLTLAFRSEGGEFEPRKDHLVLSGWPSDIKFLALQQKSSDNSVVIFQRTHMYVLFLLCRTTRDWSNSSNTTQKHFRRKYFYEKLKFVFHWKPFAFSLKLVRTFTSVFRHTNELYMSCFQRNVCWITRLQFEIWGAASRLWIKNNKMTEISRRSLCHT